MSMPFAARTLKPVSVVLLCVLSSCTIFAGSERQAAPATYTNPIITPVAADPTIIRGKDGTFYLYATNDDWGDGAGLRVMPIFSSKDLVTWHFEGTVFDKKPTWKSAGGLWAPDVSYRDGRYYLYYSYSAWGDSNACIGLATAENPLGPWSDLGRAVFCSDEIGVENSIDPFAWHGEEGTTLIWGSFHGIYAVLLDEEGVQAVGEPVLIADERFEAAYVHKRGDHYYLFVSAGTCCAGAESTYRVYVGRSENLTGPYVDAEGKDLREGGGTLILARTDEWAGPGHNTIVTDDAGADWILYHAIPDADPRLPSGAPHRPAMLDRIHWEDGWPVVRGRAPSSTPQPAPTIRTIPAK